MTEYFCMYERFYKIKVKTIDNTGNNITYLEPLTNEEVEQANLVSIIKMSYNKYEPKTEHKPKGPPKGRPRDPSWKKPGPKPGTKTGINRKPIIDKTNYATRKHKPITTMTEKQFEELLEREYVDDMSTIANCTELQEDNVPHFL